VWSGFLPGPDLSSKNILTRMPEYKVTMRQGERERERFTKREREREREREVY